MISRPGKRIIGGHFGSNDPMHRIVILGCAGTGKTTLGRALSRRLACPLIVLDDLGDQDRKGEQITKFRAQLQELHAQESWISDGNFALVSFDIRLPPATLIIWLDRPRYLCLARVIRRVFEPDQPHRWTGLIKVLAFIWRFDRINRPRIEAARLRHGPNVPLVHLSSNRDIDKFLKIGPRSFCY